MQIIKHHDCFHIWEDWRSLLSKVKDKLPTDMSSSVWTGPTSLEN